MSPDNLVTLFRITRNSSDDQQVVDVRARVGDLIEIVWDYIVAPGLTPTDITYSVEGGSPELIALANLRATPPLGTAGSDSISALFVLRHPGTARVKVGVQTTTSAGNSVKTVVTNIAARQR